MKNMQIEEVLQRLVAMLHKKPMTAREIAAQMPCSKPIAYARVEMLRKRGVKIAEKKVRQGKSGPKSVAYSIATVKSW